jgi:hypothetical protein
MRYLSPSLQILQRRKSLRPLIAIGGVLAATASALAYPVQEARDEMTGDRLSMMYIAAEEPVLSNGRSDAPSINITCYMRKGKPQSVEFEITYRYAVSTQKEVNITYKIDDEPMKQGFMFVDKNSILFGPQLSFYRILTTGTLLRVKPKADDIAIGVANFDISDHASIVGFVQNCVGDPSIIPDSVEPDVAWVLFNMTQDQRQATQEAMKLLKRYSGPVDGTRTAALFVAVDAYVKVKARAMLPLIRLQMTLMEDKQIPASIRKRTPYGYMMNNS